MRLPHAPTWLLSSILAMLPAAAAAQTVPAFDPHAPVLQRCFSLLQQDPATSVKLSESVLAQAALPATPRLGALGCQLQARHVLGQSDALEDLIARIEPLLDDASVPSGHRLGAMSQVAGVLESSGQNARAMEMLQRALSEAEREGLPAAQIVALNGIGLARAISFGDIEGAEQYFRRGVELIERESAPPSFPAQLLHYNYGYALLKAGRHEQARVQLARAQEIAAAIPGQEMWHQRIRSHQGEIARATGDLPAARELLQQARSWQAQRDPQGEAVTVARLASLELDEGRPAQALPLAERALELAEGGRFLGETRDNLELLVQVHAALGDSAQVIEYGQRLRALEQASGRERDLERLAALQARVEAVPPASAAHRGLLRDIALAVLLLLSLFGGGMLLRARRRQRQLVELSITDPLTGLLNRREASRLIEALPVPGAGDDLRHALLLLDVDGFKTINDTHGHAFGDRVLVHIADRLREACAAHDVIARWGGEEFLVVRPEAGREATFAFADELRRVVEQAAFALPVGGTLSVTLSVGVAPLPFFPGGAVNWQDSIPLADHALYVAKHAGRNAWAGIWGLDAGRDVDVWSVRQDPESALALGRVAIGGNRPMSWTPVVRGQPPRSGRAAAARTGDAAR